MHFPSLTYKRHCRIALDLTGVSMVWSPRTLFRIAFMLWVCRFRQASMHALIVYATAHGIQSKSHSLLHTWRTNLPRAFIKDCLRARLHARSFYRSGRRA